MRVLLIGLLASTLFGAPQCVSCQRDGNGRVHRSAAARYEFRRDNRCPATGEAKGVCPGYVIDHIKPLACGGLDDPTNMQWQTREAAREKDKWERRECGGQ